MKIEELEPNDAMLLLHSGYVAYADDDPEARLWLNLNDTIAWAFAAGVTIEHAEEKEVARLFREYGWPGLLYWGFKRLKIEWSEFEDNNRFIRFVANEERIKQEEPDWDKRGYYVASYTLGIENPMRPQKKG